MKNEQELKKIKELNEKENKKKNNSNLNFQENVKL